MLVLTVPNVIKAYLFCYGLSIYLKTQVGFKQEKQRGEVLMCFPL